MSSGGLANIIPTNCPQSLAVVIEFRKDAANVGRIERQVNECIGPIKLPLEFLCARRHSDHYRACSGSLIETRGNFIVASGEFGAIHIAGIRDVVSAVFEQRREKEPMFMRAVDVKSALLKVNATGGHGVVIVKDLFLLDFIK